MHGRREREGEGGKEGESRRGMEGGGEREGNRKVGGEDSPVFPQDELVVGETMRGDELFVAVRPLDSTHLGTCE